MRATTGSSAGYWVRDGVEHPLGCNTPGSAHRTNSPPRSRLTAIRFVLLELVGEHSERVYATPNFGWGPRLQTDLELRGYEVLHRNRFL
jgi:hypothetical protein